MPGIWNPILVFIPCKFVTIYSKVCNNQEYWLDTRSSLFSEICARLVFISVIILNNNECIRYAGLRLYTHSSDSLICKSLFQCPTENSWCLLSHFLTTKLFYLFQEQVRWAVEGGCDYIIAETFGYLGEALLALKVIQEQAPGKQWLMAISVAPIGLSRPTKRKNGHIIHPQKTTTAKKKRKKYRKKTFKTTPTNHDTTARFALVWYSVTSNIVRFFAFPGVTEFAVRLHVLN